MIRKIRKSSLDTRKVDIDDAYALEFWAREFNVTKDKIRTAVISAGTAAPDLKRKLKK